MSIVATDGRVLHANRAFCDLLGYPLRDLVGMSAVDLTHPADRSAEREFGERAAAGEEPAFEREKRYLHAAGQAVWVTLTSVLVRSPDGTPRYFVSQLRDLTKQRLAQEELGFSQVRLAEAEERYRTLVEQLPLVTFVRPLDLSRPNIFCSSQVESMLGYSSDEWRADPDLLARVVHPDDRDRVFEAAAAVRSTGEPFRSEYRYIARDGRVVWVQDETHLVRDESGRAAYVQGFLLDITERKLAEAERDRLRDELVQAQKLEAIGRLAGGVAHDFNNMLTAIKGYSELLLDGLERGTHLHDEALRIKEAAEQASALPRQLLAFSRKQALAPQLVELNDVVVSTARLVQRLIGAIELVVDTDPGSTLASVDPGQLEQVIFNLALNARDAMPDGGTLTITSGHVEVSDALAAELAVEPGRYAFVSVADTGSGMDAATRARAFEPFFTTKSAGGGVGLGLASVYGTVAQSGGFVRVESAPSRGSTFTVHVPLVDEATLPAGAGSEASTPAAAVRVLLAEDEPMVRELAVSTFERAGFLVRPAENGRAALDLFEAAPTAFDVLVTDLAMPGLGGRELAARIAAIDPLLPIVFMSGYSDDAANGGAPPAAASTAPSIFIAKPFSPRLLVEAVLEVLGEASRRSRDDAAAEASGPRRRRAS